MFKASLFGKVRGSITFAIFIYTLPFTLLYRLIMGKFAKITQVQRLLYATPLWLIVLFGYLIFQK